MATIPTAQSGADDWAPVRDAARLMITARLAGDGHRAGEIVASFAGTDPAAALRLALAAVDLAAEAHTWWARSVFPSWPGESVAEAWEHVARQIGEPARGG